MFKYAQIGKITPLAIAVVFLVTGLNPADHGRVESFELWRLHFVGFSACARKSIVQLTGSSKIKYKSER